MPGLTGVEKDIVEGRIAPELSLFSAWRGDYISGVKMPNGERAELGTKLEDYSLNPLHRHGQHKARVFQSVLGITLADPDALRTALERAAATSKNAVHRGNNGFGEVYELRTTLTTRRGTATILSAWIIRNGEDFPRLTTCFIV
jgi:hypothetical protein